MNGNIVHSFRDWILAHEGSMLSTVPSKRLSRFDKLNVTVVEGCIR